jgi:hypothetical protein
MAKNQAAADETEPTPNQTLDLVQLINAAETAKRDLAAKRSEKLARAEALATAITGDQAADAGVSEATAALATAKQAVLDAVVALYS